MLVPADSGVDGGCSNGSSGGMPEVVVVTVVAQLAGDDGEAQEGRRETAVPDIKQLAFARSSG